MRIGKGVIAFWAEANLVLWARYAFWARGHVSHNCRKKKVDTHTTLKGKKPTTTTTSTLKLQTGYDYTNK